ncbi:MULTISPECIES: penicillin-binding transpeptidase domain-containing protein [unclassified Enterococcus]|uniref:penicillin-binding transpeptidase domain-containing protein n=1 Tax=unclassified Enterococcus TaxID=2608891 RepID=UPI001554F355|nr:MULTISPECIES: penicillin-binding transpeptidase domain-containing protein [unclassified Enterococcus]MBS7575943.1 penicillin-binding protein 2 [Enterococcus sp. MMGLQ5-2]MBS7583176.1 penicillin-binding protein 2 [Enterococcus sp. MMGLQ5-1]NPD11036.1 penicillin-binding protein 2 [Enterococcus sp. MMGLQ5-1]NPD35779.1 penicillin-binding protein 2 [Enterococcus sp. MMGLQ5-2]
MARLNLKKNANDDQGKVKVKKGFIPIRLNLLFFVIFLLFVTLIARLGYMQIMNTQSYVQKLKANTTQTVKTATPRGQIYDSKGVALVSNVAKPSIVYTRGKNVTSEDMRKIAQELVELVPSIQPSDNLTDRDKQDYWLADPDNLKTAEARVPENEKVDKDGNNISTSDFYKLTVAQVTADEINFSAADLAAASIFKTMNGATTFNTVLITSDNISDTDIAVIGENQSTLTGISASTNWDRSYTESTSLRSILGTISTEKTGLPAEELDEYLAKGYSRNDRVGTSYLEKQYESELQGKKSETEITLDSSGNIVSEKEVSEGAKGNNLKLTIDVNFQNKVDEILTRWFNSMLSSGKAKYSEGVYAVVMDPNTGAVLAISGVAHDLKTGAVTENALGTIKNNFVPGSVVKGATITAGYETGVITGNDTIIDQPIYLQGTAMKSSVFNTNRQIPLTATEALQWSSNSYMMQLTMKMLGTNYTPNMVVPTEKEDQVYEELRTAFSQYGLGVKTGIDLPDEVPGYIGDNTTSDNSMANLLDLSFGQYDNYTTIQLAQYAATVANGGKKVQPHVVEGIYGNKTDGGLGDELTKTETTTLGTVPITSEQMSLIRQGFYDVVHSSGYATGTLLADAKLTTSAKTGTAETYAQDGTALVNANIVAYAPSENPQIAIGLMFPELTDETDQPNKNIVKEIINAYAEMYNVTG